MSQSVPSISFGTKNFEIYKNSQKKPNSEREWKSKTLKTGTRSDLAVTLSKMVRTIDDCLDHSKNIQFKNNLPELNNNLNENYSSIENFIDQPKKLS